MSLQHQQRVMMIATETIAYCCQYSDVFVQHCVMSLAVVVAGVFYIVSQKQRPNFETV